MREFSECETNNYVVPHSRGILRPVATGLRMTKKKGKIKKRHQVLPDGAEGERARVLFFLNLPDDIDDIANFIEDVV